LCDAIEYALNLGLDQVLTLARKGSALDPERAALGVARQLLPPLDKRSMKRAPAEQRVGPGTPHHLFAEMLKGMIGIETTYVPYRGSQPAITDVVAGHVPIMFCDLGPAGPQIAAGKVRALGSSTKTRLAAFPNVPSLDEAGARGFDAASWQMLVAPGKTPRPVVEKLHAELKAVLAMPDVKEAIAKNGMVPMPEYSLEGLQAFVNSEIGRWGKVVRDAGIAGSQ